MILAYRIAARVVHRSARLGGKLSRSVHGRRNAVAEWMRWAATERSDGPLIWVHGASVGEALTALPVVARLRTAVPNLQVVHTYSSSSVARWPGRFGANRVGYVPLDEPRPIRHVLDAIRPNVLAFARGDLWPELVAQTEARDIPVAVLGATVRPGSRRLARPLRALYGEVCRAVSWLGAVSHDHAERWRTLGVREDVIQLTGDPRHDQVLEHVPAVHQLSTLQHWSAKGTTLVAGSSDAEDEAVVLAAFRSVSQLRTDARLVVVPHEPTASRVRDILSRAERLQLVSTAWEGGDPVAESQCVVVHGVGALFDLYTLGFAAYVGGGFRPGGLHAAAEPAAYALPVVVGPHFGDSDDARAILAGGGGVALPRNDAGRVLERTWLAWMDDAQARMSHGLAARRTLHQGAASETAKALLGLLGG